MDSPYSVMASNKLFQIVNAKSEENPLEVLSSKLFVTITIYSITLYFALAPPVDLPCTN